MANYWLPYLLISAHFLSGAVWLVLINRNAEPAFVKEQWKKYVVYVLLFNLIWHSAVWFETLFLFTGYAMMVAATLEWFRSIHKKKHLMGWAIGFMIIIAGFWRFLYLEKAEILFAYFVVVLFDGASQISGQLFGKVPLAPGISPRKTVEGLLGGIAVTLGTALLVRGTFSLNIGTLILKTGVIILAAFTGDMLASIVKRKNGIDRFGALLPGHGGILDRFDSFLMTGFVVYMYTLIAG